MSHRSRVLFLFCFVLAIVHAPALAHAQSDLPEPEARQALPFREPTTTTTGEGAAEAVATIPWSRVAYQAFRDGNWEIIVARDDGSEQRRLASHPAADINPRLDRGGNRVAFVSNREGDLNIYVANLDGRGLRRLTPSNRDDARPAWSPDGTQIAFHSFDRGQAELYLVKPDGTGLTRLTDYGGYDGSPAWSPDGKRLAFCREMGDHVYLHEMELATRTIRQMSTMQDSCNPAYSPDGKYIAYSADQDHDTWYRLWVMNADGSDPRMFPAKWANSDYLAGAFSPDGKWIAYSLLRYEWYGGSLYLVSASALAISVGLNSSLGLGGGEREAFPDWQTTDISAPVTAMNPMPPYSRASGFLVSWQGQEQGGSGLAGYELQQKRLDTTAAWETALNMTTVTRFAATGGPGRTVGFRVAGVDRSHNRGAWSEAPQTQTTLFASGLDLTVTDNRGAALQGVAPAVSPAPVTMQATGIDGRASVLLSQPAVSLTFVRPGYGSPPALNRTQPVDGRDSAYLPPARNRISNGHIEDANTPLNGWTTLGNLPITVVGSDAYSGARAVSIGDGCAPGACLAPRETVLRTHWEQSMDIAVDAGGRVHLVYGTESAARIGLHVYTVREPDGTWSEATPAFGESGGDILNRVALEMDDRGTLHAAFNRYGQNSGIFYARKQPGKPWSAIEAVRTGSRGLQALQFGPDNTPVVILDKSIYRRSADGSWPRLVSLEDNRDVHNMRAAVDPNGFIHVVWDSYQSAEFGGKKAVFHETFLPDGTQLSRVRLLADEVKDEWDDPSVMALAIDARGTVHAIIHSISGYTGERITYYLTKPALAAWNAPSTLPLTTLDNASLVIDSQQRACLLYDSGTATRFIRHNPDGSWSAPVTVAAKTHTNLNVVEMGRDDRLHAILAPEVIPPLGDQNYFSTAPSSTAGSGQISQTLTIPGDMPNPTLAFMKQVLGDEPDDSAFAFARLSSDSFSQDFPISGDAEWSLGWVDATPWKGKTVTVTFGLTQTADAPALQLRLDAISLGPAFPDTQVMLLGQPAAMPGEEVPFTLVAGNRGAVAVDEATVSLVLPPGLSLKEADPTPTTTGPTLSWALGALAPGSEQVVAMRLAVAAATQWQTLELTTSITSGVDEPEAANNTAISRVFVGSMVLVPMAAK